MPIDTRSGSSRWLVVADPAPRPQGLTCQQTDALHLLAAQAAALLRRDPAPEHLYSKIFHAAAVDLVLIAIEPDGSIRIEDANPIHLANLGLPAHDVIGHTLEEVFGPDSAGIARSKYAQVIATKQTLEYEAVLPFPNGARYRRSTMVPLIGETGRVERVVLTSVDLTERRRAEEQLRQMQKVQALGQLTGGVAHDFNNLLTIIMGGLELIGRHLPHLPKSPARVRIEQARRMATAGVDRAATLTQRLLAFARRQSLAPRRTDVNALIKDFSRMLCHTLGDNVELKTDLANSVWATEVDPHQLENALLNLAVNARDAMPKGGTITIETANAHLDGGYVGRLSEPVPAGDYVLIAVSDDGCGMDDATLEQAFEPFFTTKEPGKGTGLGLSQVYGFVRQSGGHARIYSEPNEGTTVRIYLPRLAASTGAVAADAGSETAAAPEGGTGTVLVVEDEDMLLAYSSEVLQELGYQVLEAPDGQAALDIVSGHTGIDLMFTDIVLPGGLNGQDLAEKARHVRPGLKVLFTTGYASGAARNSGRIAAGTKVLAKPFSYNELAVAVRQVMEDG